MVDYTDRSTGSSRVGTPTGVRVALALLFALAGAFFASEIVAGESRSLNIPVISVLPFVSELVVAHFIGGAIAGFVCAPLIGRGGAAAIGLSVLGALAATILGGILGGVFATVPMFVSGTGSLMQIGIGAGVGAATVPLAAGESPATGIIWIGVVALAHVVGRYMRWKRAGAL